LRTVGEEIVNGREKEKKKGRKGEKGERTLVKASSYDCTEERTNPVDPVVRAERPENDGGTERASRVEGPAAVKKSVLDSGKECASTNPPV
jgi:hypothetical protein